MATSEGKGKKGGGCGGFNMNAENACQKMVAVNYLGIN